MDVCRITGEPLGVLNERDAPRQASFLPAANGCEPAREGEIVARDEPAAETPTRGGKRKGVKGKRTVAFAREFDLLCKQNNISPASMLVKWMAAGMMPNAADVDQDRAFQACIVAMRYRYAQPTPEASNTAPDKVKVSWQ